MGDERIGRYELGERLGHGGFGSVFRAFDPAVNRMVALKTLNAGSEPDVFKRFRNEAASAGRLRHPNIVIIHDFGEHQGNPYLVMELLEGEDLDKTIKRKRPLLLLDRVNIMLQMAAGLHHAHSMGVVHRDVKPANVMLLPEGTVKILDFGIALVTQATISRQTPKGAILGTFAYMAPEQFSGAEPNVVTDIFSYGITCYSLLTNEHPFDAPSAAEVMLKIVTAPFVPVRQKAPECPEALEEAVARMLAKKPALRYQSLDEVRFDLNPIIRDLEKARAAELVNEAQDCLDNHDVDNAQNYLRRALALDSGNSDARSLRERIQKVQRENTMAAQQQLLYAGCQKDIDARRFADAEKKLHAALALESEPVGELPFQPWRLFTAIKKFKRAEELVKEASQAISKDLLAVAVQKLEESLSLDSKNSSASALLAQVREQAAVRDERLRKGLQEADSACQRHEYEAALAILENLARDYPAASEVAARLKNTRDQQATYLREQQIAKQAQKDAAYIAQEVKEARDLDASRAFDSAITKLENVLRQFPDAESATVLLKTVGSRRAEEQREQTARRFESDARSLIDRGEYGLACDLLREATQQFPANPVIGGLYADAQHRRHTAEMSKTVAQAKELSDSHQFPQALSILDQALQSHPSEEQLLSCRDSVLAEQEIWERRSERVELPASEPAAIRQPEAAVEKVEEPPVQRRVSRRSLVIAAAVLAAAIGVGAFVLPSWVRPAANPPLAKTISETARAEVPAPQLIRPDEPTPVTPKPQDAKAESAARTANRPAVPAPPIPKASTLPAPQQDASPPLAIPNAPPPAVANDAGAIHQILTSFSEAVEHRSAMAIKEQWPNASEADLDRWSKRYENAQSLSFSLNPGAPQIDGSLARVECRGSITEQYPGNPARYSSSRTMYFQLRKIDGEWKITSVR